MLTVDELMAVVRVHADRVHDAVRRLGCGPDAAVEVVERSARELVDTAARQPDAVGDPVGWWYARARALARGSTGGDDVIPLGGGVLSTDANQVRLAEVLESLPERERAALLLRDSYDLPASAVGTALSLDAGSAYEVIARARLDFLPALTDTRVPRVLDHPEHLAPLARLAEGGPLAAREGATRRHAQSCETCGAILDAQERARRLLQGLTVVALPDTERERILAATEARAWDSLPAAPAGAVDEWDDEPHRHYPVSLMVLGVVLAGAAGIGIGALASRGSSTSPISDQKPLPLVTAPPVINVKPVTTPSPTIGPSGSPTPRVFLVTPSPTPTPSSTPTPTASSTASPTATLALDPSQGPADSQFTVTGQGWTPGADVLVQFINNVGGQAGATAHAVADAQGSFVTTLTAHDSGIGPPAGAHRVTADDGTHHAQQTFTVV